MAKLIRHAAVFLCLLHHVVGTSDSGSGGTGSFVDAKDRQLQKAASDKKEAACAEADSMNFEEEQTGRRAALEAASADNILLKVLKAAADPDSLAAKIQSELLDPMLLITKAGPIVFSFIMLGVYLFCCCWVACPFCKRCCRCCARERKINIVVKFVFLILLGGLVFGMVFAAGWAFTGFDAGRLGFEVTRCAQASIVDSTLSGQENPHFLGVVPTLEAFDALKANLDGDSEFITELKRILKDTSTISNALTVASGVMGLLQSMLAAPQNEKPVSGTTALLHQCTVCPVLAPAISDARNTLDNSLGTVLDQVRTTVDEQLSGDTLQELQNSMTSAAEPLMSMKSLMHSAFGPFVEDDLLDPVSDQMKGAAGTAGSALILVLALLVAFCGFSSVGFWICIEKKTSSAGQMTYRKHTHCCACFTWCSACWYAVLVFFLGGLMTILAIPFSSLCLVMEDLNAELLNDIGAPLGMEFKKGDIVPIMVEECFRNPDPNANPLLLKLIKIEDNKTMYDMIVGQTKDMISGSFDQLSNFGTGDQTLNGDENIVKLKQTLGQTKMDGMMLPDFDAISADTSPSNPYAALIAGMPADPQTTCFTDSSSLPCYLIASSAKCEDDQIPADMGDLSGKNVWGVNSFAEALRTRGAITDPASELLQIPGECAYSVTSCPPSPPSPPSPFTQDDCAGAATFMGLKKKLVTENIFKCFTFQNALGQRCDVKNMATTSPYSGDCMVNIDSSTGQGEMNPISYDCDLEEFTQQIADFQVRLDKVFARLDAAAGDTKDKINQQLRDLVDQYVLDPITEVADGMRCGFLGQRYQLIIDGMCYGGAWGFSEIATSYVACASLTFILMILMFIVWRISIDNYNALSKKDPLKAYSENPNGQEKVIT
eukprot:TRINITY_DN2991_c0_g1_i3.p1 TRINITY_DN2991_c0_g1~~TRINITY_DN2991_c0_g1_i3.p1  ORF type:complete len:885 (-),score=179.39 TRINITY_DN2991_c0_g1_i3:159-2813(-)